MAGQADPSKNKYAHLHQLSTDALNALLRADIESTTDDDDEAIFYILKILEQRELEQPTGRLSNVGQAWEEFQKHYNTPEGNNQELYPSEDTVDKDQKGSSAISNLPYRKPIRIERIFKQLVVAAVVLTASLIVAQASGFDVLGALGRWTEETFHFTTLGDTSRQSVSPFPATDLSSSYYESFVAALREFGIKEDLAPTWYPEGFTTNQITTYSDRVGDKVYGMFKNETELYFDVSIYREDSNSTIGSISFEKDDNLVEEYTSNGRTFYILSNIDSTTATWSDGQSLVVVISGSIPQDEILAIIDSMGG